MMYIATGDAITATNVRAGVWKLQGGGQVTPWYMLEERADGRQAGVVYADGLEGAFRGIAAWASQNGKPGAGAVVDMAA